VCHFALAKRADGWPTAKGERERELRKLWPHFLSLFFLFCLLLLLLFPNWAKFYSRQEMRPQTVCK